MSGLHGQFGLWEGVLRLEQCLDHTVWTLGESSPTQTMSGSHSLDFGREFSDSSNIWISQFGLWGKSSPTQAMSGLHGQFGLWEGVLRLEQCLDHTVWTLGESSPTQAMSGLHGQFGLLE